MKLKYLFIISMLCFIFLEADPQKTLGIFTYKVYKAKPWDPESIKSGITGSEEAVIYMSQKLAKIGYKVFVFGNPPVNSPHSLSDANPRFVDIGFDDGTLLDVAISWRQPKIAGKLKKRARNVYLWPHDSCFSNLSVKQINAFDDVLWLSNWQRQQWVNKNPGLKKFTKIFGNGINPEQFNPIVERSNKYSCIYGSNYGQGLDLLLDVWPDVKKKFPLATLDIYYGWQHWGLMTPEKEAKMKEQIVNLAPLAVCEHGLVSHEELNRAYEKSAFWTYPCRFPETFCITALKAQLSGCIPVLIKRGALYETARHGYVSPNREEYLDILLEAMSHADISLKERNEIGKFVVEEFTWENLALKWKTLFDSALSKQENKKSNISKIDGEGKKKTYNIDAKKGVLTDKPIRYIQIFGERCSGTNFLRSLLQSNFSKIEVKPNYGHKHFPCWFDTPWLEKYVLNKNALEGDPCAFSLRPDCATLANSDEYLFVIIFRNSYDWLRSFYKQPHQVSKNIDLSSFGSFIRSEWNCDFEKPNTDSSDMIAKYVDRNPFNDGYFKNVLKLRSARISNMLNIKNKVKNCYYVNYETLREHPEDVIKEISAFFSIEQKKPFKSITSYKGFGCSSYKKSSYFSLTLEDRQFINNELNEELENSIGYELADQ